MQVAAYAASIALIVTSAGCADERDAGFEDGSAEDIVAAALRAMGDLESVRVDADIQRGWARITMDVSMSATACEGSMYVEGGTIEVLKVDGDAWFKGDRAFWETHASEDAEEIMAMIGDRWSVDREAQLTAACDLVGLIDNVVTPAAAELENTGTDRVDGQEVVKVKGDEATLFVAIEEPHYVVRIEAGGDNGEASFSEFDEDVEVEAPADNEVVDLSSP